MILNYTSCALHRAAYVLTRPHKNMFLVSWPLIPYCAITMDACEQEQVLYSIVYLGLLSYADGGTICPIHSQQSLFSKLKHTPIFFEQGLYPIGKKALSVQEFLWQIYTYMAKFMHN